jgi:hypothetical protein
MWHARAADQQEFEFAGWAEREGVLASVRRDDGEFF